ncbi:MAG: hypothetical protein JWL90_3224 [Chthoniobacteraceae bacterium]|nr:hypothetical protein [Chthoniobacteraceae bacterium]
MKVFLSWSGNRSKAIAEVLDTWIKCVIQAVTPWISTKNIDRGSIWFSEISDQLADTKLGIICLTQENKNKPWILFEAGALAKGLNSNRVCTILIDLKPSDIIANPLSQFNHTTPDKDGIWQLVQTINSVLGDKALSPTVLERVFETYWPQFEEKFKAVLESVPYLADETPQPKEALLEEILTTMRGLERQVRQLESKSAAAVKESSISRRKNSPIISSPFHVINDGLAADLNIEDIVRNLIATGYSDEAIENAIRTNPHFDVVDREIVSQNISAFRGT